MTELVASTPKRSVFGGSDRTLGHVALLAAVTTWGIAPLFVRAVSASGLTISTLATAMAAGASALWAWRAGTPLTRQVFRVAALGGVCHATAQTMSFTAFHETSLAIAALIGNMSPLIVVVAAVPLFGERLRAVQLGWSALALAGVTAVALGGPSGGEASLLGDLIAVGSLVASSGYILLMKHRSMAGVNASAYMTGVFIVSAAVQIPIWLLAGEGVGEVQGWDWWWLLALALLPNSFGTALLMWAQRHVSVALSSVLVLGTAVISAAGGWLIFGQELGALQLVGGPVVLGALAGLMLSQAPHNAADKAVALDVG